MVFDAATDLASRYGWSVFPVLGKRPLVKWRDESTHEPVDGTVWAQATGVGVDCGKSGLVVLDSDRDGAISDLTEQYGALPATLTSQTGKGAHFFFKADPGSKIGNGKPDVWPVGLDVRGDGGYVVVPPSQHPDGGVYRWGSEVPPAPLPVPLVKALAVPDRVVRAPVLATSESASHQWAKVVLERSVGRVFTAKEGERNDTLFKAAVWPLGAAKAGHISREMVDAALVAAAVQVGLSPREAEATLSSAWNNADPYGPDDQPPSVNPPSVFDRKVQPERRPMTVLSLGDLSQLKPPTWLLSNRIPEGITLLWGESWTGKSMLALDWTLTMASINQRPVVYFAGEGLSGIKARTEAWQAAHPTYHPDMWSLVPEVPRLLDPSSVADLVSVCEQTEPQLIVIDTYVRSLAGGNENSTQDATTAVGVLDMLRREFGLSTILIHHQGRVARLGGRGSTVPFDASDCAWLVEGTEQTKDWYHQATCKKLKDGDVPQPFKFSLTPVAGSVVVDPSEAGAILKGEQ